jgi:hypothetical protein
VGGALPGQGEVDFSRDVQPILSDRCFLCHGPDANKREAGLRLDVRESALRELPSGRVAIVPGKPERSEMLRRLTAHDDKARMPPPASKLAVTAAEVATLRRWVAQGAPYAAHWSFLPLPAEVALPPVKDAAWGKNGIDAFVLSRLEHAGLQPSAPATPEVLARRLGLTLTGLPPSDSQRDEFLRAGRSDQAVDQLVSVLLGSKRYGERMASEWLDVARYADTFGYQSDVDRPVWAWRDWVIGAFNDNLPFHEFATWQIAGDLLPDATQDQRLATAFQRLHRQTNEGGSVEAEMRLEYVADRTETFATAFLGMTVGCARCHDHKFDPISQREYYELSAFFDNIDESGLYSHFTRATPTPALSLTTKAQSDAEQAALAKVRELEGELDVLDKRLEKAYLEEAPATAIPQPSDPDLLGSFAFDSLIKAALVNDADQEKPGKVGDNPSLVAGQVGEALQFSGENWAKFPKVADFDRHQPFSLALWLRVPEAYDRAVVLHRAKAWTDAGSRGYELLIEDGELSFALVHFWPGNAVRIRANQKLPVDRWTHVTLTYDGSSQARGMAIHVDGDAVDTRVLRDCLTRTIQGGGADALTLSQRFRDRGLKGGAIDELRVYRRELTRAEARELAGRGAPSSIAEDAKVYVRARSEPARALRDQLRDARRELGKIRDSHREIMVMREMATRRATYVRPRGSYLAKGARVEPATPACLPGLPEAQAQNRMALARWLTADDHPLTARVAVNRAWQMHFGSGLVGTAEDFGSQGSKPTHPALLDWLARWFVSSGWDVKALHRLIVSSATFRQASSASPALRGRDPENRLLARGPRYQLAAEMLRDQALWASGLLVERLGGPPVRPYQPDGLWREKSGATYHRAKGDGLYRRSLYTYWKRTSPPPAMLLLDASKRDICVMRRQSTSTPLQALLMLNDPQFVESARIWAEDVVAEGGADNERLTRVFKRLAGRSPGPRESAILSRALADQRGAYRGAEGRARKVAAIGDRTPREDLDVVEVAAWTMVISMLMNFDEVVRLR